MLHSFACCRIQNALLDAVTNWHHKRTNKGVFQKHKTAHVFRKSLVNFKWDVTHAAILLYKYEPELPILPFFPQLYNAIYRIVNMTHKFIPCCVWKNFYYTNLMIHIICELSNWFTNSSWDQKVITLEYINLNCFFTTKTAILFIKWFFGRCLGEYKKKIKVLAISGNSKLFSLKRGGSLWLSSINVTLFWK